MIRKYINKRGYGEMFIRRKVHTIMLYLLLMTFLASGIQELQH